MSLPRWVWSQPPPSPPPTQKCLEGRWARSLEHSCRFTNLAAPSQSRSKPGGPEPPKPVPVQAGLDDPSRSSWPDLVLQERLGALAGLNPYCVCSALPSLPPPHFPVLAAACPPFPCGHCPSLVSDFSRYPKILKSLTGYTLSHSHPRIREFRRGLCGTAQARLGQWRRTKNTIEDN